MRGREGFSLPALAVERPVTTVMFFAALCLLGILSFRQVPVQLMPDFVFPTLFVQGVLPGADPEQVERDLLTPLEGEVSRVAGVADVSGTARVGQASLEVRIHPDRDLEMAYLELQERVQAASVNLPREARVFTTLFDTSQFSGFVMMLSLRGDVEPDVLRRVAEQRLAPRLEGVEGVVRAAVTGGQALSVSVEIDPEAAAARGLSPFEIRQSILQSNRREAHVGHVVQGDRKLFVSLEGRLRSPYELADLVVAPGPVLLRDVADIQLGLLQDERRYRVGGLSSVGLYIAKDETANLLRVGNRVRDALEEIRPGLAEEGLGIEISFDASAEVRDRIHQLIRLAAVGAVLALLVLLLFLRDLRAVGIIAVAIPVSVLVSGVGVALADLSIDVLTLMGMALAVGMLVDNAIVSLEAIERRRRAGQPLVEAARRGGREVQRAMMAATLTTSVVFLPLAWVESDMRSLWIDFALSILMPLAASLLVALLLVPMLASVFLKQGSHLANVHRQLDPARPASAWLRACVALALRRPGTTAAVLFTALLLTFLVTVPLLAVFFVADRPAADRVELALEMPAGTPIEKTDTLARELEGLTAEVDGVEQVETVVEDETAFLTLQLFERDEEDYRAAGAVRREVEQVSRRLPEGRIVFDRSLRASGGGGGGDGGEADPLGLAPTKEKVVIRGSDHEAMVRLAARLRERLEQLDTVLPGSISSESSRSRTDELHLLPDRTALAMHGLNVQDVMRVVWSTRREVERLDVPLRWFGEDLDVAVGIEGGDERALEDLARVRLATPDGGSVPLEEIGRASIERGPREITREDRGREISFEFRFRPNRVEDAGALEAARREVEEIVAAVPASPGVTASLETEEPGAELKTTLYLGLFLLYLVLAVTFESFVQPVVVLFALPLAAVGVLWALVFTGTSVETTVLLGLIVLAGLVVNGSILLVDRAQSLQRVEGYRRSRAIVQATRDRTRPVLMTAATTILGLLPLALKTGVQNEIWPPLAITVIGGMTFATLLTLVIIPVGTFWAGSAGDLLRRLGWVRTSAAVAAAAFAAWLLYGPTGLVTSTLWRWVWAPVLLVVFTAIAWAQARAARRREGRAAAPPEGPRVVLRNATKVYGQPGPFFRTLQARRLREARRAREGEPVWSSQTARRDLTWELPLLALMGWLHWWFESRFWLFVLTWATWAALRVVLRDVSLALGWSRRDPERARWVGAWEGVPFRAIRIVLFAGALAYAHLRCDLHWLFTAIFAVVVVYLRGVVVTGRALREGELQAPEGGPEREGRWARMRWLWRRSVAAIPGLGRSRERVLAVQGVELEVGDGMFGLLGPNGAGKTTLLRMVAGVLEPSRGRVEIEGLRVVEDRELLQGRTGYLPQDAGLYDHMTARAYLEYHALLMGIEDPDRRGEIVTEALESVGLGERADERVGGFSGGMRQRVGIARTLLDLPSLLVVDEPTVGLDPAERIRFRTLLARLARDRTVLFSTHVVEDVATACDRLAVMDRGRVRYVGTPEELRRSAEGAVWEALVDEAGAAALRAKTRVVHTQREATEAGGTALRVRMISRERPSLEAEQVEPSLEDAYLLLVPPRGARQEAVGA